MQQMNIQLGDINVPIIIDKGEEWFPVSFITTKVLLRSGKKGLVNKNNKDKLSSQLQKYTIQFGEKNIQESNCISKTGLIELLQQGHIGRLNVYQRVSQNELHKYLGIDLLSVDEQDTNKYNTEWLNEVDGYTKEIIEKELDIEKPLWVRMCSKCNCHYPLTSRFYHIDNRADKGFAKVCRVCSGKQTVFINTDSDKTHLMKTEESLYTAIMNDDPAKIYEAFKQGKIKKLPDCYENKEFYLTIIRYLFDKGILNVNNLTITQLVDGCKLRGISNHLKLYDIYTYLFGEDFYLYVWKYPKFTFRDINLTHGVAIQVVRNYIEENRVTIENIFSYNYTDLFNKCRIRNLANNDILGFIVKFHEYKYAGYLFKTASSNYYKDESNLLFDLKYLIEKDMKLEISKIPLYLTKNVLHIKSNALYGYIVRKGNGSLYEWINRLYPNQFIEADFEINAYRNEFDSDKEMLIHEVLCENFQNVIYNQKHTSRTISLDGMIPDWVVMTENGVFIVEYFGLYVERQYGKSSRVTDYIDKTKRKIERYKEMQGYRFIFLYPEDVEDDEVGIREIIAKVKENPYVSMV